MHDSEQDRACRYRITKGKREMRWRGGGNWSENALASLNLHTKNLLVGSLIKSKLFYSETYALL